jgi:pilus assembly protein Flp/PilA
MLKLYFAATNRLGAVKKFFAKKEEGATVVEYAILLGLLSIVSIVVIGLLGTKVKEAFNAALTALTDNSPTQPTS